MPGTPALRRILLPLFVFLLLIAPTIAHAQAQIKVGDATVRFGLLLQGWGDEAQDAATKSYAQNLFIRRIRLLVGGQINPNISFFFDTDNPNDGKAAKSLGTGFITQDAFIEWKPTGSNAFMVDGGLFLPPFCRNCLVSAATILPLDYNSWSFVESAATQSVVGRDTGFQLKGYVFNGGHLEYRAAVFQGFRASGSRNPFRTTGRVQYNVYDTETGYTYPGFYFGNKHILAVGVGMDRQSSYKAYTADVASSSPTGTGNALNWDATFYHFDGGTFLASIPRQRDIAVEAGYYVGSAKVQPFARYEKQQINRAAKANANNDRQAIGITFFPAGHNFNVKGQFQRINPRTGNSTNEYTVQVQFYYY